MFYQLPRPSAFSRSPSLSSYNPYDGPNEHPEAELPLVAGKYLYVYGDMDDDGFYEGERRSLSVREILASYLVVLHV